MLELAKSEFGFICRLEQRHPRTDNNHCGGRSRAKGAGRSRGMIEVTRFTPEEIDEAVDALDVMQKIMTPWFIKQNFEGMGEQDAADV